MLPHCCCGTAASGPAVLRAISIPMIRPPHNLAVRHHRCDLFYAPQDTDASKEAGVADSAVAALGAVAAVLPWAQYEQLLSRFLRLMKASGTKFLVRRRAVAPVRKALPVFTALAAVDRRVLIMRLRGGEGH